jgi:hypothetical protein
MRQLSIQRAAVIILFGLLFALAARFPTDTDTWWHLRSAEYTLQNGIIYSDPFSFTKAGEPWINHSWGAQIVLYGFWLIAGNLGLSVFMALLATLGMWYVYRVSVGSVYLRAFTVVIGAATAAVFWSPRPQMFSFLLSAVLLYLLHLHRREGLDRLWLIPVLMAIWGNLHAGFSIGFILLGGSIAGAILSRLLTPSAEAVLSWAQIRKLVFVTIVSVVAIVINPYGLQMLAVPFQTVGIGALQNFIQEWNSPDFHGRETWPFILLMLGTLGAVGAGSKRLDWTDFLLFSGTAFMALLAGRNIALFAVVATPILTRHLDSLLTDRGWIIKPVQRVTPRMVRLNLILVSVILLACVLKVLTVLEPKTLREAQALTLPLDVTDHLRASNLSGPMFNSYNWGGYFMFAWPQEKVFVDGRTDLYGDQFLTNAYLATATGADGWRDTLDRYGIRLVVVEAGSGLARALAVEPGWRLDYGGEGLDAVVFVRETA